MRGHKGALFSKNDYGSLQQCESLEDVKLFLVRHPSTPCLDCAARFCAHFPASGPSRQRCGTHSGMSGMLRAVAAFLQHMRRVLLMTKLMTHWGGR